MQQQLGLLELNFVQVDLLLEQFINGIQQIKIIDIELWWGKLFDQIGFNAIKDELLENLFCQGSAIR